MHGPHMSIGQQPQINYQYSQLQANQKQRAEKTRTKLLDFSEVLGRDGDGVIVTGAGLQQESGQKRGQEDQQQPEGGPQSGRISSWA